MPSDNYYKDVARIEQIEFSIYTNADVKKYSAVSNDPLGINLAESYEQYEPKKGGLVDLALGTCDIYLQCATCGLNSIECPGHFGHTVLASPVFNFGFLNHLKNILQCVCLKCSNILVDKTDINFKKTISKKPENRFKEIKILTKNINFCVHCGVPVPKIKREVKDNGSIKIMIERDINTTGNTTETLDVNILKKTKESLSPLDCSYILRNISDSDCFLLGFNSSMHRPEDLIIENFPIPPSIIRPTAKVDFLSSSTSEDALTLKIADIITANKRVRNQMEKETLTNELSTYSADIFNLLQFHIATYYDNSSVSLPRTEFKTGGRQTKSIVDRIKGKKGRMRSNLMGKRVDFSGRTVITSDPYIAIDQVGIPKKMAMELTIPEEVTPHNIKYLSALVKNGKDIYPGANFVLRTSYRNSIQETQKIDLKYRKKAIKLQLDDVVERHATNNDFVLFNRQPTLHKPSMMGHRIQVIDDDRLNTFRVNVSVCKPYNADFDGDEMNIHMPQSHQARNELKYIANVQYQIIGMNDSSPIIGCQQDALSGAYMLTEPTTKLYGWEVANILCNTSSTTKFKIKMTEQYTGHEIFSHIIPEGINITNRSGGNMLQITDGKLLSGYLNDSALSFKKNSIIHFIWDKYGPYKTKNFIDDAQRLVLNYLLIRGQSVGLGDTIISKDMKEKIKQIVSNKILASKHQITQFENDNDQTSVELIESSLSSNLDDVQSNIGQILMSYLKSDNFFWCAAKPNSGAKGSLVNIAQMIGVLGQNNVDSLRIKKKIEGRTLIFWHKDDDTPEARGFIKSSYFTGLTSAEFVYNTMAGREGLIDTAIKSITRETPIIIIENKIPKYVLIGEWIDEHLVNNKNKVQYMEEQNMEIMDLIDGVYIPTIDYDGNVSWGEISAITRHDPGDELYEIKTYSGRSVIVTASKSLLVWNEHTTQFKEMLTTDIKIGNCVPVTCELNQPSNVVLHIDKLSLTENNGILIGLFLADAISISQNTIIIKNDNIIQFINSWLDNNSHHATYIASFLSNLVNNNLENKYIPSEAFVASEPFIIGLLNGYCSINSFITDETITITAKNKRLIEGINMLCSRIGIFGIVYTTIITSDNSTPLYGLDITAQWGKIFSDKITLLDENKNKKIKENKWSLKHNVIKTFNNVVLDPIIEINIVSIKEHPKVYDLTIPSTFNFGLANGLQVRDTAQTGYIQRQLIKGLEDLIIKYDGTNRNAKGLIIQIVFGENGINQACQTELLFKILTMDNKTLADKLTFNPEQLKKLEKITKLSNKELTKYNTAHFNKLKYFRDEMRDIQMKSTMHYKSLGDKFAAPVNLFRITQDYSNNKVHLELTPAEIHDAIENFLAKYENRLIVSMKETDVYIKKDDRNFKFLLEVALNEYLAPVKCIFEYGLSRKEFLAMMDEIQLNFTKAIVEPGEMVGIVAAQSIGEPTSQMSCPYDTQVKIIVKNNRWNTITFQTFKIGELCDEIIRENPGLTIGTGHPDSVETNLSILPNEYYIIGVDSCEQTHWNKISHISKHPVNGQLMRVTTRSGRITTTTLSHSHLIRANQTVEAITGANLRTGMRIPVTKHIDNTFINDKIKIDKQEYQLDHLFGWFIGAYLAEGSINGNTISISNVSDHFINRTTELATRFGAKVCVRRYQGEYGPSTSTKFTHKPLVKLMLETMGTRSFVKRVPDFAFTAPNEFKAGLLQAYFDGDGNFQADKTRNQIRVCSRSKQLICDIALLLNYFDIFGSIKENTVKEQPNYNLSMCARYGPAYQQSIGTELYQDKLAHIVDYAQRKDAHNLSDEIDKINGLGELIGKCGKVLGLPGQSRTYGRWAKKESIGRRTLSKYIDIFAAHENAIKIQPELTILKQALNSNVIWDEIVDIKIYTPDQNEYVYDFTVPGNQTFMVDSGIIVHNTLNTKHLAGVAKSKSANAINPIVRVQELMHYSKNSKDPQMHIYFTPPYSTDRTELNKVISYFKHLTIRELALSGEIYYDIGSNNIGGKKLKADNVTTPFFINNQKADVASLPFVFRIKLNMDKMIDKETSTLDIKTKFISYWYKNYTNLKNLKKNDKDVISKISRCAILSNNITDNEQIIHIRFSMSSFNYNIVYDFLKMVFDDITLKGIENIQEINVLHESAVHFNKDTGSVINDKEYVVYTNGININSMRLMKGIDHTRTKCNDIFTVLKHYGIEAARCILAHELTVAFESKINQSHLSVLVDQMCYMGEILSIDRHGLGKIDMDPLARASFERTMDHFANAALFNEKDSLQSLSSRVAVGRVISGGTGAFDLLLDTKKISNSEYTENEKGGRITYPPLEQEPLLLDIMKYEIGKTEFYMPNIKI
jgi:DNA-directed RNA polymerase beta' subunit